MSYEYPEQEAFDGEYSWYWTWRRRNGKRGGFQIHRLASFQGRGGVIRIAGYGTRWQDGKAPKLDVYVWARTKRDAIAAAVRHWQRRCTRPKGTWSRNPCCYPHTQREDGLNPFAGIKAVVLDGNADEV